MNWLQSCTIKLVVLVLVSVFFAIGCVSVKPEVPPYGPPKNPSEKPENPPEPPRSPGGVLPPDHPFS